VALAIILTTLIARVPLPFKIPGALGSLLIAGGLYYLMRYLESAQLLPPALALPAAHAEIDPQQAMLPYEYWSAFRFEWVSAMNDTLSVTVDSLRGTVVSGIDYEARQPAMITTLRRSSGLKPSPRSSPAFSAA
jgi:AGZA family xanthine/uracil permease-like MFS transporter